MAENRLYQQTQSLHPRLPQSIEVIDCTLRDGEQSPGVAFTVEEKVELASSLVEAGIGVLDAGFQAASSADREAMQAIDALDLKVEIAATARPISTDIAAAEEARASEVFMFMPTSDFRLSETLGITRKEAESTVIGGAEEVVSRGMAISLVFEDATRADPEWLAKIYNLVSRRLPVKRVVLADTVGCSWPTLISQLFETLAERTEGAAMLCAHCHNDFGLAVSNTLMTVAAGATAITCTINGIGERAGNADLSETVAGLSHLFGVEHGVDPLKLASLSTQVEQMSGIQMSAIKPVTGFNVFRHESGVHVDGMIKDSRSYQYLPASWVGREPEYVLGKHSGVGVVRALLKYSGQSDDEAWAKELVGKIKRIAESDDKRLHHYAHSSHQTLIKELLAGVNIDALICLCDEVNKR